MTRVVVWVDAGMGTPKNTRVPHPKAAEWAVRKQKSHQRVSPQAMMSVVALVNIN